MADSCDVMDIKVCACLYVYHDNKWITVSWPYVENLFAFKSQWRFAGQKHSNNSILVQKHSNNTILVIKL